MSRHRLRRLPAALALAALLSLLAAGPGAAQPGYTVVESGTAPLRFYVGDPVELRLRVRVAAGAKAAELRAPAKMPSASWLDVQRVRVAPLGGGEWDVRIELVSFAPGPTPVPRLDLGAVALEDPETGATLSAFGSRSFRLGWQRFALDRLAEWSTRCRRCGVETLEIGTSDDPGLRLDEFFKRRRKRR